MYFSYNCQIPTALDSFVQNLVSLFFQLPPATSGTNKSGAEFGCLPCLSLPSSSRARSPRDEKGNSRTSRIRKSERTGDGPLYIFFELVLSRISGEGKMPRSTSSASPTRSHRKRHKRSRENSPVNVLPPHDGIVDGPPAAAVQYDLYTALYEATRKRPSAVPEHPALSTLKCLAVMGATALVLRKLVCDVEPDGPEGETATAAGQ